MPERFGPAPPREYPDWNRLLPARFLQEVYGGEDDWMFCHNSDWESLLIYVIVLLNKEYQVEGGMPGWLKTYVDTGEVTPFDHGGEPVVLVLRKPGWVTNTLTFFLEDKTTPTGFVYNNTSRIQPEEIFKAGGPPPGNPACPQSVWEPRVVRHMEHIKDGGAWDPEK